MASSPASSETFNPCGLRGIAFLEFASNKPAALHELFMAFGFSRIERHSTRDLHRYVQNDIEFMLDRQPTGFAADFVKAHGPSLPSMGWRVDSADAAFKAAVERGAKPYEGETAYGCPAIYGIGDSLIHFVEERSNGPSHRDAFIPLDDPDVRDELGFLVVDHLTNNVEQGTMARWATFYKEVFGFTEVRYFDIRGAKTGLTSYALRSPDGSFCIPINEGSEAKSQINEYLREYNGPGVQHIAFLSRDLLGSLEKLKDSRIETLDIDDEYYGEVFERVPGVREDPKRIRDHQVLVDGDEEGYLLQIFTRNLIGPIFIEMIQRENHLAFGEGNFGALFRSIERDQAR
ncbi:MAG: 4-hydroxyphenylpyruvate dioxygenase, partial [Myxococcota bacterium]